MKNIIFCIVWIFCFNSGNATVHVIRVWSGYYQFIPPTFTLDTLQIQLGDTIQWLPLDSPHEPHTITSTTIPAGAIAFDVIWQAPADTFFQYIPAVAGLYNYECTPHVTTWNMIGFINVQNSTGIADNNQLQTNISVYPNPSNGQFQFSIDNSQVTKHSKIEIYNVQGKRIYQSVITNTKPDIDLSNQPNGIYFVKFYNGQTVLTKKIVIE